MNLTHNLVLSPLNSLVLADSKSHNCWGDRIGLIDQIFDLLFSGSHLLTPAVNSIENFLEGFVFNSISERAPVGSYEVYLGVQTVRRNILPDLGE